MLQHGIITIPLPTQLTRPEWELGSHSQPSLVVGRSYLPKPYVVWGLSVKQRQIFEVKCLAQSHHSKENFHLFHEGSGMANFEKCSKGKFIFKNAQHERNSHIQMLSLPKLLRSLCSWGKKCSVYNALEEKNAQIKMLRKINMLRNKCSAANKCSD